MQKSHKAAGSIIANIVKQKLMREQENIDKAIRDGDDSNGRIIEEKIVSNDKGFLKGDNIKVPETGISINDVFEFLSGLFGRKNITGTVYEDKNVLFLQIDISGDIFTEKRYLKDNDNESSLHTELIGEMADVAIRDILIKTSEKYRLYYFCAEDISNSSGAIDHSEYKQLYKLCNKVNSALTKDTKDVLDEINSIAEDNLSNLSDIEQFILISLKNKIEQPELSSPSGNDQKTTPSLFKEIGVLKSKYDPNNAPLKLSSNESHDAGNGVSTEPSEAEQKEIDEIQQRPIKIRAAANSRNVHKRTGDGSSHFLS